ncbi:MAG: hypothetical protein ACJAT1_001083 [Marivirga sp.]
MQSFVERLLVHTQNIIPMTSRKYLLLILILIIYPFDSWANSNMLENWTLVHEHDGMSVYSRSTDLSDIKEIRVSFTVASSMNKIIALLADVPRYKNWVYKCSYSERVKTINENEFYYYTVSDFPIPFEDRDLVIKSKHWLDNETGIYYSQSEAVDEIIDKKNGLVRIPSFSSTWTIKPLETQLIQIEYQVISSAGGLIPSWLVNLAIAKGPLETMVAFKALVLL